MIVERDKDLKRLNTLGLSAKAVWYAAPGSVKEVIELLSDTRFTALPKLVIGSGSNTLFCEDYNGLVVRPAIMDISISEISDKSLKLKVGAGVDWDKFVAYCVDRGWGGVENLSGIPGCVGASPVQNIGAYGSEAKDTIVLVDYIDICTLQQRRLTAPECHFGYRESIFKQELKGKTIITYVTFELALNPVVNTTYADVKERLKSAENPTLYDIRKAIIDIRKAKLPDPAEVGNAGSFFKNPIVEESFAEKLMESNPTLRLYPSSPGFTKIPAAWLIEQCGFKGVRELNVGVHKNHALVLLAYEGATGRELLEFAQKIKRTVKARFSIDIDMEVNVTASS
ncbi:MAG: UDP-N-acetylenolpyruvoylglucosamine reductase [Bacteroidetes bacterium HGW-Bacteroidetes-8]|jgi:UDP-N-acetylmuramate dehydrogenase|nr:MAG: UDP-N-acetylenolpyruvoylglucosamine reductase [Bacteroidetes bacterium HGW-Bacteroidetes-8]